jgi:hypothetical protein
MNRRDFLKSLAALGAALAIPFDALAAAPESVIDTAWQAALDSPTTFYVNEYGTLSTAAEPYYPSTRAEMLQLDPVVDYGDLIGLAHDECGVACLIEDAMADDQEDVADSESDWEEWIARAAEETVEYLIVQAEPDSGDWETANLRGYSDQGGALYFFRDVFEENDLFNIVVVEGDCPGSSYFAAELRMDIDEANELAVDNGIPILFAPEVYS